MDKFWKMQATIKRHRWNPAFASFMSLVGHSYFNTIRKIALCAFLGYCKQQPKFTIIITLKHKLMFWSLLITHMEFVSEKKSLFTRPAAWSSLRIILKGSARIWPLLTLIARGEVLKIALIVHMYTLRLLVGRIEEKLHNQFLCSWINIIKKNWRC